MKFIGGGRVGGVGGKLKAGNTIHKETNSSVVCSVLQGDKQQCCVFSIARRQTAVLCVQYCTETATVNLVGQDGHQQQFDTPCSLIGAHRWPHGPCSGPSWFYRVVSGPPVRAGLAIYSPIIGTCG